MIKVDTIWQRLSDLTINDAAFWMALGSCPHAHAFRCGHDEEYAAYFSSRVDELFHNEFAVLFSAVRTGEIEVSRRQILPAGAADSGSTYISKDGWLAFCEKNGYWELVHAFSRNPAAASSDADAVSESDRNGAGVPAINPQLPALVDRPLSEPYRHTLKMNRQYLLAAEIDLAKKKAVDPDDTTSVWVALTRLAEEKTGPMIGFSSDGIQYRGTKFQASGVPDVFTLKSFRARMQRARDQD